MHTDAMVEDISDDEDYERKESTIRHAHMFQSIQDFEEDINER